MSTDLQRAAELLNENAPKDGPFQERIAYINPLEEEILKSIGGSGEVIIPPMERTGKVPPGYSHGTAGVPSYGVWKWFKKKVMDDALGIDDNKFLGIKKKTFIGGNIMKITDDILGIDSKKTFGVSDATWDDALATVAGFVSPPLGYAITAADMAIDNNWSGGERVKAKKQLAAQREALAKQAATTSTANMNDLDLANHRALMSNLVSRGKTGLIDPSDSTRIKNLLASPGDESYIDGFSVGGQDMDPFPSWLRKSGDTINQGLNDAGEFSSEFIGDTRSRMEDYRPIMEKLQAMSGGAIDALGGIYDKGEGGIESQFRGFQDKYRDLSGQQQGLNTRTARSNQDFVDSALASGDKYADALRNSHAEQGRLTNLQYDQLDQLPDILRQAQGQVEGRLGDTRDSMVEGTTGLRDARLGGATGLRDARLGGATGLRDTRLEGATGLRDTLLGGASGLRDTLLEGASGLRDTRFSNSSDLLAAEQAKAMAQRENARDLASGAQRNLGSSMVGQGRGTEGSMASQMINAQLGAEQAGYLADTNIRDAQRRALAEEELSRMTGAAQEEHSRLSGSAGEEFSRLTGAAGEDYSRMTGAAGEDFSRLTGAAEEDFSRGIGAAGEEFSRGMQNIIPAEVDELRASLGAERLGQLAEINPALGEVYGSQANLQNRLRALDYGDQVLMGEGANLGIDQSLLDDDRSLTGSLMNMRLGNSGMINSLGLNQAMLPGLSIEAGLSPLGPLVRNVSPYTSTGSLPAPVTAYNPNPYTPTPSSGGGFDWKTMLRNAPQIIKKGKEILG